MTGVNESCQRLCSLKYDGYGCRWPYQLKAQTQLSRSQNHNLHVIWAIQVCYMATNARFAQRSIKTGYRKCGWYYPVGEDLMNIPQPLLLLPVGIPGILWWKVLKGQAKRAWYCMHVVMLPTICGLHQIIRKVSKIQPKSWGWIQPSLPHEVAKQAPKLVFLSI